jgi:GTPase Era involved in 16S rRNA processing
MTAEFIPRSDLVFFVTSAGRPFTETERAFMEHIRGWGKKIVVVVNKSDILDGAAQVAEIRSFVADNARASRLRARDLFCQRKAGASRQAERSVRLGRRRLRGA